MKEILSQEIKIGQTARTSKQIGIVQKVRLYDVTDTIWISK